MSSSEVKTNEDDTKDTIRQRVWDYIETNNLANFPRPVHHRIPNFKGAAEACDKATTLDCFKKANIVKVNPDKPQQQIRFKTLEAHKTLLVPTPRLRNGLFNKIVPPQGCGKDILKICSTTQGVKEYSVPVGLDAKIHIDLVVIGSVAVSSEGYRIGKGEGFADLEFAMAVSMGAVDETTQVVSVVHDCQVMSLNPSLFGEHDLFIDWIVTPSRVIQCPRRGRPKGVIWSVLPVDKFKEIPILKSLRYKEQKAGKDVRLKDESEAPSSNNDTHRNQNTRKPRHRQDSSDAARGITDKMDDLEINVDTKTETRTVKSSPNKSTRSLESGDCKTESGASQNDKSTERKPRKRRAPAPADDCCIFVGGIPRGLRVSEFKGEIRDKGVNPRRVTWVGGKGFVFLWFEKGEEAAAAVAVLGDLEVKGVKLRIEMKKGKDLTEKED